MIIALEDMDAVAGTNRVYFAGEIGVSTLAHTPAIDWKQALLTMQVQHSGAGWVYQQPRDFGNAHHAFSFTTVRYFASTKLARDFQMMTAPAMRRSGRLVLLEPDPSNVGGYFKWTGDNCTLVQHPFDDLNLTQRIAYNGVCGEIIIGDYEGTSRDFDIGDGTLLDIGDGTTLRI